MSFWLVQEDGYILKAAPPWGVVGHWNEAEEVVGCSSIGRHSKLNRTEPWASSGWDIELCDLDRSPSALIIQQFQNEILVVLLYCCLNQK